MYVCLLTGDNDIIKTECNIKDSNNSGPLLLFESLLCFLLLCSCAVGTSSPLHYSALHSHHNRMTTSSPGLHSRVHSPISIMAALR